MSKRFVTYSTLLGGTLTVEDGAYTILTMANMDSFFSLNTETNEAIARLRDAARYFLECGRQTEVVYELIPDREGHRRFIFIPANKAILLTGSRPIVIDPKSIAADINAAADRIERFIREQA